MASRCGCDSDGGGEPGILVVPDAESPSAGAPGRTRAFVCSDGGQARTRARPAQRYPSLRTPTGGCSGPTVTRELVLRLRGRPGEPGRARGRFDRVALPERLDEVVPGSRPDGVGARAEAGAGSRSRSRRNPARSRLRRPAPQRAAARPRARAAVSRRKRRSRAERWTRARPKAERKKADARSDKKDDKDEKSADKDRKRAQDARDREESTEVSLETDEATRWWPGVSSSRRSAPRATVHRHRRRHARGRWSLRRRAGRVGGRHGETPEAVGRSWLHLRASAPPPPRQPPVRRSQVAAGGCRATCTRWPGGCGRWVWPRRRPAPPTRGCSSSSCWSRRSPCSRGAPTRPGRCPSRLYLALGAVVVVHAGLLPGAVRQRLRRDRAARPAVVPLPEWAAASPCSAP